MEGLNVGNTGMLSNTPDVNTRNFIEVLLVNLKLKQEEIKKLKDCVQELEHKSKSGIDSGEGKLEQRVPKCLPMYTGPEHKPCVDVQKQSNSDIFLFPATKSEVANTSSRTEVAYTSSTDPNTAESTEIETEAVWKLIDTSVEPAVVPEQDFNNVINELIKTKTLLHKYQIDENGKWEELSTELHNLRSKNEKLERSLKKLQASKLQSVEQIAPLKELNEDTLDLSQLLRDSTEHTSLSTSVAMKAELDELKLTIKTLKHENEQKVSEHKEMVKKNQQMQKEIVGLRENVKILTNCLQEEKSRATKAMSSLGSLRQQHELLRVEKEALEKERILERRPSKKYTSSHYTGSRLVSSDTQHSGSSTCSTELPGTGIRVPPITGSFNIKPDPRSASQNNLSPQPAEKKPSNLPTTAPSIEQCPRCLYEFIDDDEAYRKHLHKCMNV